jgi:hypothetical protein
MEKWIIKAECRGVIGAMIRRYGITPASLFPGIDGIAKFIEEHYGL